MNAEIIKHNGIIVLSENNQKMRYIGYSLNNAKKLFKKELKKDVV